MKLRDTRPYVCVTFDLLRTATPFLRRLSKRQRIRGVTSGTAYVGDGPAGAVVVYIAGSGMTAMHDAITAVLKQSRKPTLVLGAGLAVGLTPGLAVGSIVQPAEILDATTEAVFETADVPGVLPHQQGRLVTVPRLPNDSDEARIWAELGGADSADLESAEAIRLCGRQGVPFTCLRAMLADVETVAPPDTIAGLDEVGWRMVCQPQRWSAWQQWANAADRAAQALALCLYTALPGAARGRRFWDAGVPALAVAQPAY